FTPNFSSRKRCLSAALEKNGVPPEDPVGLGTNFRVLTATGDQADCGMTGPFAPGNTQPLTGSLLTHPGNQYCSPAFTAYPSRWLKTAGKLLGSAGSPRTVPVIGSYPVLLRSEKLPDRSSRDGTLITPEEKPRTSRVPW